MKHKQNIIFVTIDAWRADFAHQRFAHKLCPALDDYKDQLVDFSHMYANGPWTTPGLLSMFTGQSAAKHGIHYAWSTPKPGTDALARRFKQAGYACPNLSYLNGVDNYFNLGYEAKETPKRPLNWKDDTLFKALDQAGPFFLWYHYKYVHLPYWPEVKYRRLFGVETVPDHIATSVGQEFVVPRGQFSFDEGDREVIERLYAANVLQMNTWLQRLLSEMKARNLFENTSLVLSSDHGEELMDHGFVGHASTAERAIVNEEVLRIPLMVIDQRIQGGRTCDRRVQGTDIFPTLLSLANIEAPPCDGLDLTPSILQKDDSSIPQDRLFYARSASMGYRTPREKAGQFVESVSDGHTKLICENLGEQSTRLYDLQADPQEQCPSSVGDTPWFDKLKAVGGLARPSE